MTSDRERRDVARRLREIEQGVIGALIPTGELAENILRAIDYGHSGAMTPYGRLADLIEPEPERICHPIFGECDLCKWPLRDGALYCDHCGARIEVVDDAD